MFPLIQLQELTKYVLIAICLIMLHNALNFWATRYFHNRRLIEKGLRAQKPEFPNVCEKLEDTEKDVFIKATTGWDFSDEEDSSQEYLSDSEDVSEVSENEEEDQSSSEEDYQDVRHIKYRSPYSNLSGSQEINSSWSTDSLPERVKISD